MWDFFVFKADLGKFKMAQIMFKVRKTITFLKRYKTIERKNCVDLI